MDPTTEAQIVTREAINENTLCYKYLDSEGITTLGIGDNLEAGDAEARWTAVGADWAQIQSAPTAKTGLPEDAVDVCVTLAQVQAVFKARLPGFIEQGESSLGEGIFNALTPARQYVIVDLCYNLGLGNAEAGTGWMGFINTRAMIDKAQKLKAAGDPGAHDAFVDAANALRQSLWYKQTGRRAQRDTAMMEVGTWCDPNGTGNDIL